MICPDCNNDIMDGAKACPYCGTSFINKQKKQHSDILNRPISQMSIREQAAMKELKGISTFGMTVSLILLVVGFLGLFYGICTKNKLSGIIVFISVIIIVIFGEYYFNSKNKMERMKSILDDKQRKAICPYCKSPFIKQRFVKASSTRGKSRTRVSKNINPFHPYSYRNYDTKPVNTSHNYKTTYYCQTCGSVFDDPEIFEYE